MSIGAALLAFAGGIVSFFSPCVAPLVPGYIGFLSGTVVSADGTGIASSAATRRLNPVMLATLIFVAGFSVAFIALGLLVGSFGRVLAAYQPVMQTIAGIVMVVMGAFLLGLLPRALSDWMLREGRLQLRPDKVSRLGLAAPFALGIVFAAGWTPCIGPVLATILAFAGASASVGVGAILLTFYAVGFALPFLAVGLGWSAGLRALGWVKRYGHAISLISGGVLIVVGVLYLTGEVAIFSAWAQQFTLPFLR
ncbi:MAG TPA: cytochrome c biogenesis protein CcdA [Ktedonobacterales bacterium]|jgi:cytochrome c-type biogenesis protein|nr:cytochrome c biogenesis protein CcdA [Ktedonobacterales bacterium]